MSKVASFIPWSAMSKMHAVKKQKEDIEMMKMNGPEREKLGQRRNVWQWEKHVWLYSNLLQAL